MKFAVQSTDLPLICSDIGMESIDFPPIYSDVDAKSIDHPPLCSEIKSPDEQLSAKMLQQSACFGRALSFEWEA